MSPSHVPVVSAPCLHGALSRIGEEIQTQNLNLLNINKLFSEENKVQNTNIYILTIKWCSQIHLNVSSLAQINVLHLQVNIWCAGLLWEVWWEPRLLSPRGDRSWHAEEETRRWLTRRHQRCGRACSRPRSALQTDLWSVEEGWVWGGWRSSGAKGSQLTCGTPACGAGRAGLGKLLSLTSSHGVKILRQTPGVNCQIMSSTSLRSLRFHCECLSRPPLSLEDFSVVCTRVCKYIKCVSRCFEVCLPEQLKQNRIIARYFNKMLAPLSSRKCCS